MNGERGQFADPFGEQLLSVPRAARRCGISATLLHELLDNGAIPYVTPNKHRRVRASDVTRYLNQRRTAAKVRQPVEYENALAD